MAKPKSKTKANLDYIFSLYIRLRDSYKGKVKCPLCWKIMLWRDSQNMHFVKRTYLKYRRDEENCYAGCKGCNVFLNWNYQKYTMFMIKKFWVERVEQMINDKSLGCFKEYELAEMCDKYAEKFNEMAKNKQIPLYFNKTKNGNYTLKVRKSDTLWI